jgi:hypothetical protein
MLESFRVFLYGPDYDGQYVEDLSTVLGLVPYEYGGSYYVEQNIDLAALFRGVPEYSRYTFEVHFNLCGELSMAAVLGPLLGLTVNEFLIEFAKVEFTDGAGNTYHGVDILADRDRGMSIDEISTTLESFGSKAEDTGYANSPITWQTAAGYAPQHDQLADLIEQGKATIALVNLDTNRYLPTNELGHVEASDGVADAGHFVVILQTITTAEGEELVRIYNPYQHKEEWISHEALVDAWAPGGPDNPNYRAVAVSTQEQ